MLYGLERNEELKKHLEGKNVGLVMNQASLTHDGRSTLDVISSYCHIKALFALEHGIRGAFKAGEDIQKEEGINEIPVISLYHGSGCGLEENDVKGLDAIVYDIQDLGLRFYTYIASLKNIVEDCNRFNLELILLDRPCPFGRKVWGNILPDDSLTFVGPDNIPVSYAMTPGEAAIWFTHKYSYDRMPTVIKLQNWSGEPYWINGWDWIRTSPNIPDFNTAFLYAGMCFVEGSNMSEGRGTDKPFRLFGAPWIDSSELLERISRYNLRGFEFKESEFTPNDSKHKDKLCHGLEITVTDYDKAEPVKLGLIILSICFSSWKETEVLPDSNGMTHMDRLTGKGMLEEIIRNPEGVYADWEKESSTFRKGWIY